MSRGFGVAAGLDPEVATPLATRCDELGYSSMWSNDTPFAFGLETLAAFAEGTDRLALGVTIAVDRHDPIELNSAIERLGLDRDRLLLAVASGTAKKPLTRMREIEPELRDVLPGVRLILSSMGPKMCALAGAQYDGAFFNWMSPEFAASAREQVRRGASEAGHEAPLIYGYVRVAVGDDATDRLTKEETFYRDLHDGYRNHFDRLAEPEGTVGIAAPDRGTARQALIEHHAALDVVVVRALASASMDAMGNVAEAAAPETA